MSDKELVPTQGKDEEKERPLPAYYSIPSVKKRAFLKAYGECGSIIGALRMTKISQTSHFIWMDKDELYRQAFEDIQPRVLRMLQDHVMKRIKDPKRPSDLLCMFEMERRDPQYRDNYQIQINSSGPTQVNFNLPTLKIPSPTN